MSADRTTALDTAIRAARKRALATADAGDPLDAIHAEVELRLLDRQGEVARLAVGLADRWLRLGERLESEPMDHGAVDAAGDLALGTAAVDALRASIEDAVLRQTLEGLAARRREGGR